MTAPGRRARVPAPLRPDRHVLGLGDHAGQPHPDAPYTLTSQERELFNLWVLLGAQYR